MIRLLAALATLIALGLALNLPTSISDFGRIATWAVPFELVAAATVAVWFPRRWSLVLLSSLLAWFVAFRVVDWVVWQVMGRPITLVFDVPLLKPLLEVSRESLGLAPALALPLAALLPLLLIGWIASFALATLDGHRLARPVTLCAFGAAVAAAALGAVTPGRDVALPLVSAHGLFQVRAQLLRAGSATAAEQRWDAFEADDARRGLKQAGLLRGLDHVDVWLVFVESYGRTALEQPSFASRLAPRLSAVEGELGAAGLSVASGWLTSPTVGGQSWLAHATLTSGVLTDDEASYAVYRRRTHADLAHLFAQAGHRTVLAAPGMLRPYPEATESLGFAAMLGAAELRYAGPRFDWVTMPDQFALEAARRATVAAPGAARQPVFVQAALVGSHAPFTPRPSLVADWDQIGDGSIYATLPISGGPATAVWRDRDDLRSAYVEAIDLTLETLGGFARRISERDFLLILVGDHEPAGLVTGAADARMVPMHVIARDRALLQPFLGWGFTPALRPDRKVSTHDMAEFRSFFVEAFSETPPSGPIARSDH